MKKILTLIMIVGLVVACQKKHPISVFVDPAMKDGGVEKVAVFPFATSIHSTEDPDQEAPRMMDQLFRGELDARNDYKFMSPTSVEYTLDGSGLRGQADSFIDGWTKGKNVDKEFLSTFGKEMQIDAVLVGVVDLWQKDEVDVQENASAASYVGATITILSVKDGKILFEASDEDVAEGAKSETSDRKIVRSGSGKIYNDPSAKSFRAPPIQEVAAKVARALAFSIPQR